MIKYTLSALRFFFFIYGAGGQKKAKAKMIFTSLIIRFYIHFTARNTLLHRR